MGKLQVIIGNNEVVAEHRLGSGLFQRYVLPEHEAAFYRKSRSSQLLGEQFARLGSAAAEFEKGLREDKRAAAGYHMSRILELAAGDTPRVAEALRHAARYQAFDSHAVERIVKGRHPRHTRRSPSPAAALPEKLAEYLKGAGEFQRGLDAYQRLAPAPLPESPQTEKEEVPDGQRRDGPADHLAQEAPPAAPRPKSR
jgi:hypothetical protein